MMDLSRFIIAYTIVLLLPFHLLSFVTSLENNLYKELESYEIEITRDLTQELEPVELKSYKTSAEELWRQCLGTDLPTTVDIFNRVYIIRNNKIVALLTNASATNETEALKELAQLDQEYPVKFVRTIKWKATLYMLLCYDVGPCSLYTGTSDMKLARRQRIKPMGSPMDATFFTQKNRLYLVLADCTQQSSLHSMIYHWNSTYMDVVTKVETSGAVSVTTFNYKQWTIIIFGQRDTEIGLKVYAFEDNVAIPIQYLPTNKPVSVHHFHHGIIDYVLLISEDRASEVFWFRTGKNKKLMLLHEVPSIGATSSAKIVSIGSETFAFIVYDSTLQLFAISGMSDWIFVHSINVHDDDDIVDVGIETDGEIMKIALITENIPHHTYYVQLLKLHVTEDLQVDRRISNNAPTKCYADLVQLLKLRMTHIEEAQTILSMLYAAKENETIIRELRLPGVHFTAGSIGTVQIILSENIKTPMEIQEQFDNVKREIDQLFSIFESAPRHNGKNNIKDGVWIDGDVFFDEFIGHSVELTVINGQHITLDNILSLKSDQNFTIPLKGRSIAARHLEIDEVCGIPSEYWTVRNDEVKTPLPDIQSAEVQITNDTIYVLSNVSLKRLRSRKLNDIDIDQFLNDIFLVGRQQEIKGTVTYKNQINVISLNVESLNGVPSDEIFTKITEQKLNEYSVRNVEIADLHTDFINDIPIDETARKSRANIIKGTVRLANLHVKDEFNIQTNNVAFHHRTTLIYDNVTINGNLAMKNIALQPGGTLYLNNLTVDHERIFERYWSKSSEQMIEGKLIFPTGLTINRLNASLINGLKEDDFLYTTLTEIPKVFGTLHFGNIHVNAIITEWMNMPLFQIAKELVINEPVYLEQFNVKTLLTNVVNDIPINTILDADRPLKLNGSHLFALRVGKIYAICLDIRFLNKINVFDRLKTSALVGDNRTVHSIVTAKISARNFAVEIMNGINITHVIQLENVSYFDLKDIVIYGDLIVENDLKADNIGGLLPEHFLSIFTEKDIILPDKRAIDNLVVLNLRTNLFHDFNVKNLFHDLLSKSKDETFLENFSFTRVTAGRMYAEYVDNQATSKLVWTDEPIYISSNVTFTNLFVDCDVNSRYLNGHSVTQLYNSLLTVPTTEIDDLRINGSVSWTASRDSSHSFTHLLQNLVTKSADQHIESTIAFDENINVATFIGEFEGIEEIRSIVSDAVIDDRDAIMISSRKTFMHNFSADSLTVLRNVDISSVNGRDIIKFNDSIVRKHKNGIIRSPLMFRNEVTIERFFINETVIHGTSIIELALTNKDIPDNAVFQDLHVQENIFLKYIDDIVFDEFVNSRVTLNESHEVRTPVQFNGLVQISGNALVETMNGTNTSEMVIDSSPNTQLIIGAKTFLQDIIINGSVSVPVVNSINVFAEFENGVANDRDVDIIGDLVFQSAVTILDNTSVTGLVNDIDFNARFQNAMTQSNCSHPFVIGYERNIYEKMHRAKTICETLRNLFFYLEEEQDEAIQVSYIDKVDVTHIGGKTQLYLYGQENGSLCELPADCNCATQYVIDLSTRDRQLSKYNDSRIAWNYYDPNGAFRVIVDTNVTSYSEKCTDKKFVNQFTSICWVTIEKPESDDSGISSRCLEQSIKGYLKDVAFFTHNDAVYIVMAMYYNIENATHHAYSAVYKLGIHNKSLSLVQEIPTHGGWSIEVFRIDDDDDDDDDDDGIYMLIGCYETTAVSLLYKFDENIFKFTFVRSFPTRSRFTKSLSQKNNHFILLDDPSVNGLQIYKYNIKIDSFNHYQSFHYDSPVSGIGLFYVGEFGISDAYVIITIEGGQFFIYEYILYREFQLVMEHWMEDVQVMTPFSHENNHYIFSAGKLNSTIFRIVQQGPS